MLPALQYKALNKSDAESNVPGFPMKLWKLVDDPNCDDLVSWNADGTSFIISNQAKFAKDLLPKYFKHNNMASFIRQLNLYGFRKRSNLEHGSMRGENDILEFYHRFFLKDQEGLLEKIKRKVQRVPTTSTKPLDSTQETRKVLQEVLFDVKNICGKQENMNSLLSRMKKEKEFLWKEVAILRQKHHRQQQIVDKLIRFLVTFVKTNGVPGIKRSLPQVLSKRNSKMPRYSGDFSNSEPKRSEKGSLVIHDVTEFLDDGLPNQDSTPSVSSSEKTPANLTCSEVTKMSSVNKTSSNKVVCIPSAPTENVETVASDDLLDLVSAQESTQTNANVVPEPYISNVHVDSPEFFTTSVITDLPSPGTSSASPALNTPIIQVSPPVSLFPSPSFAAPSGSLPTTVSSASTQNSSIQHTDDTEKGVGGKKSSNQEKELQLSIPETMKLRQNFTEYLEDVDTELDWLQKLLSQETLNIDADKLTETIRNLLMQNTEQGVNNGRWQNVKVLCGDVTNLTNIDPMDSKNESKQDTNQIKGNELIQYIPPLLTVGDSSDNLASLLTGISSEVPPIISNSSETAEQPSPIAAANVNDNLNMPTNTVADTSFSEVPPLEIDSLLFDGVFLSDDESVLL
ncbi:uncharacterized protein LOC143239106 isoform X2 [Tachypleus tridentatus]|uniref:uncharacterized protein LOC143239106 isoform X2 n=1 Tax=Tachypleus tridentatus TaxID=6853 RepID=UPI003FD46A46